MGDFRRPAPLIEETVSGSHGVSQGFYLIAGIRLLSSGMILPIPHGFRQQRTSRGRKAGCGHTKKNTPEIRGAVDAKAIAFRPKAEDGSKRGENG